MHIIEWVVYYRMVWIKDSFKIDLNTIYKACLVWGFVSVVEYNIYLEWAIPLVKQIVLLFMFFCHLWASIALCNTVLNKIKEK